MIIHIFMYLEESELFVNCSLLLFSSPYLLLLLGTNLSLAFTFLNPPWNAALACIHTTIKNLLNISTLKGSRSESPYKHETVKRRKGQESDKKGKNMIWAKALGRSRDQILRIGWGRQSNFRWENKTIKNTSKMEHKF